jgi:hypothetical protein
LVSLFFALSFCFLSLFPVRFFASVSLCFRFRNVAFDTCLKLHLSGRKHLCLTYLFSKKRWRENKKKLIATANCDEDAVTVSNDLEFPNRMSKCRLLQKLKSCLPQTPIKRASAIAAYLKTKSPTIQILEEKK